MKLHIHSQTSTLVSLSLEMDEWFHLTPYNGCNYLSMQGLKLNHISKRGPRCWNHKIIIKYYTQTGVLWVFIVSILRVNWMYHNETIIVECCVDFSVGNSHRSTGPRPTTLEEDREHFVNFSFFLCLRFEIQGMRTYNVFDWVLNTGWH